MNIPPFRLKSRGKDEKANEIYIELTGIRLTSSRFSLQLLFPGFFCSLQMSISQRVTAVHTEFRIIGFKKN